MMNLPEWVQEFPGAITICDRTGIIVYMNDRSQRAFAEEGGAALLGSNLLDCHPEPSRRKLAELLENAQSNSYTIEKRGVHKFIHQTPWYQNGDYQGLVELSVEIPASMPHFVRQ
jgi:transcriptional regulator with PAS, ATPase and Fis domain